MDYNNYVTRFAKPTMYALGYISRNTILNYLIIEN